MKLLTWWATTTSDFGITVVLMQFLSKMVQTTGEYRFAKELRAHLVDLHNHRFVVDLKALSSSDIDATRRASLAKENCDVCSLLVTTVPRVSGQPKLEMLWKDLERGYQDRSIDFLIIAIKATPHPEDKKPLYNDLVNLALLDFSGALMVLEEIIMIETKAVVDKALMSDLMDLLKQFRSKELPDPTSIDDHAHVVEDLAKACVYADLLDSKNGRLLQLLQMENDRLASLEAVKYEEKVQAAEQAAAELMAMMEEEEEGNKAKKKSKKKSKQGKRKPQPRTSNAAVNETVCNAVAAVPLEPLPSAAEETQPNPSDIEEATRLEDADAILSKAITAGDLDGIVHALKEHSEDASEEKLKETRDVKNRLRKAAKTAARAAAKEAKKDATIDTTMLGEASIDKCFAPTAAIAEDRSVSSKDGKVREFQFSDLIDATIGWRLCLGAGGFGSVHYGTISFGNVLHKVAVKILLQPDYLEDVFGISPLQQFQAEVDILGRCDHPNIICLIGECHVERHALVYEHIDGRSLDDLVGMIPARGRLAIATQVASGLAYLHDTARIVHRDINTANILVSWEYQIAKISDFGLALPVSGAESKATRVIKPSAYENAVGRVGYLSPEIHQGRISIENDIFAFGVVLLELLTKLKPARPIWEYATLAELALEENHDVLCGCIDEEWMVLSGGSDYVPHEFMRIARSCLESDPRRRPKAKELVTSFQELALATKHNAPTEAAAA